MYDRLRDFIINNLKQESKYIKSVKCYSDKKNSVQTKILKIVTSKPSLLYV